MSLSTTSPAHAATHPQPSQRGVFYAEHVSHHAEPMMMMDSPQPMMKSAGGRGSRARKNRMYNSFDDEAEAGVFGMAAAAPPEMSMRSAVVESAGDLGASYQFQLQHPVNISSSPGAGSSDGAETAGPRKLLVDSLKLTSTVFSYAVPSADQRAYLRAWGDLPKDTSVPIIKSDVSYRSMNGGGGTSGGARIFIQGAYSGETSVQAVQPGGTMRLSLGLDKNLEVKHTPIFAKHSNTEEDKSTWFITDKTKFRVKTEEFSLYAKSTHAGPMLAILADSIPVSTEEDVTVGIISPDPHTISNLDDSLSSGGDAALEAIFAIVGKEPPKDMQRDNKLHVFFCKKTGHMYWVRWLNPSDTIVSSLKYKLTWPDKKEIVVV
jgi:hypothetical protein